MIDVERIKTSVDCRVLVARDLGKPKTRGRTYSSYKCPLHHEQKGYSLVVYADHWQCFGKCGRGGDAIAWMQVYHQFSFREACERLAAGDLPRISVTPPPKPEPLTVPPHKEWQRAAREVAEQAMETLWSSDGKRAWHYLMVKRGLSEQTILDACLGYIPGDYYAWQTVAGLHVPCGITLPWFADDATWGIKVRRAAGEPRYQQVSGGNLASCLYGVDLVQPGLPLLITEGEFDALIARQVAGDLMSAVALGSASNWHINPRWYPRLLTVPRILVRMDADAAGAGAAAQLAQLSRAVTCVQVPVGKDVNDFFLTAGLNSVRSWVAAYCRTETCVH